ncbi:MAG: glycosyltransferase [Selenomonadaceae bacterium]|nr:glycosyltransferase [Selenomonadaceae bacterium]
MISVIVPIYKVENYLDRCVESIVNQTYSELEIILVDDGSPDNCPAICDRWARKDSRIKVIHKANGGLSDARNAGIEISTGEYLLFIDSDDYILPQMCERLLNALQEASADIALCNLFFDYGDRTEENTGVTPPGIYTNHEILKEYFLRGNIELGVIWNKLFRRSLFFTEEHIRYPVGRLHEDQYTTHRLLYAAKKTVIIAEALYVYVQRDGSITHKLGKKHIVDTLDFIRGYIQWGRTKGDDVLYLAEAGVFDFHNWMHLCKDKWDVDKATLDEIMDECTRFVRQEVRSMLFNPYAGWKRKVKWALFRLGMLDMAVKVYRWLRGKGSAYGT